MIGLKKKSPRLFNLCRSAGSSRLLSLRGGGTFYINDFNGFNWIEEKLEVEEVIETPELGPGDTLLMRFNTIHTTQSSDGKWNQPYAATPKPASTQTTMHRHLAVALRTCDPETPNDWHRVATSHTQEKIHDLVNGSQRSDKRFLNFTAYQHNLENNFGTTLGDILPILKGKQE